MTRTKTKRTASAATKARALAIVGLTVAITATMPATIAAADDELRDDFQDFSRMTPSETVEDIEFATLTKGTVAPLGFKLKFSTGATYNSNPRGRPTNDPDDWVTAPGASLEWTRPSDDLALTLSALTVLTRGNDLAHFLDNDQFALQAAVNSVTLGKSLGGFVPSLSFKWRETYQPVFGGRTQRVGDTTLGFAKKWSKGDQGSYTLLLEATDRSANPEAGNRDVLAAKFTLERKLSGWTVKAEPRIQYSWYGDGFNNGREDFVAEAKVSFEHNIRTPDIKFGFVASIGKTFSNRPANDDVVQFVIGPSLNYAWAF